jgi:hypothetical protein
MTNYAADYTDGGVKRTCLLDEGAVTVSTGYGLGGGSQQTRTFASEITKGMVVSVSTDTSNTVALTFGSVLVNRIANSTDLVVGIVISEPIDMVRKPVNTAAADSLAKRLAGRFLRAATVWFPNITAMTQATLTCTDAVATVPGTLSTLILDVSACNAAGGLFLNDIASGGSANMCSMHYQAKSASAVVPIMIAFLGGKTVAQT